MRKTVLIVEDHPFMRSLLIQLFIGKYNITCVDNAISALQWMDSNNTPNLIISDLLMPEMDGFELLNSIRASSFFQKVPIIILSGLNKSQNRMRCLKLGADDFIPKPFNPDELLFKVNKLIQSTYYEN
ncbi:MAG: response regulator [Aureispira sp.]|nr:response regulator [Aureispira sp.]